MEKNIKFLIRNNQFFIEYVGGLDGDFAFRLFRDDRVVEKKGYCSYRSLFFSEIPNSGKWFARLYIRSGREVVVVDSDVIEFKDVCHSFDFLKEIKYFDIRDFADLDKEIDNYFKNGFLPMGRSDLKPWQINLPLDWLNNPYSDRNWMYQMQAWRILDPFLIRFSDKDLEYIKKIINDWTFYEKKTFDMDKKWLWYDMSVGLRALKISYFILRALSLNKSYQLKDFDYLISSHLSHLTNRNELNMGNHGIFQLNGLMALLWVLEKRINWGERTKISEMREYAIKEMETLLHRQLGEFGVHTENSPDYHFFVFRKITALLEAPWWSECRLEKIKEFLQLSEYAQYWFVTPAGECVPVGDSSRSVFSKYVKNNLIYKWPHQKEGKYIAARLDGYGVVRSIPNIEVNKSSFLFFQGAFHSTVHKHSDDLSFVWQECGKYILTDSGKYGYQSDRFREYFLSGFAHNTLNVDGVNVSRLNKIPYGSAIEDGPIYQDGFFIINSFVFNENKKYKHRRILLFKPKCCLYVLDIVNNLKSNSLREIDFSWNFDSRFSVVLEENSTNFFLEDVKSNEVVSVEVNALHSILNLKSYRGSDDGKKLLGWNSSEYLKVEASPLLLVNASIKDSDVFLTKFQLSGDVDKTLDFGKNGVNSKNKKILKILNEMSGGVCGIDEFESYFADHYKGLNYSRYMGISHAFIRNENSNSMFVSFHGSIKPPSKTDQGTILPCFRLHDLKVKNQPNVLCFSDLMLEFYKEKGVYLAWFLDSKNIKQRDFIQEIVEYYMKKFSLKNVLFHGSSGGGHISIDMACRMKQTALVSNCQFILNEHSQFIPLDKQIKLNNDELMPFDLLDLKKNGLPKKIISYCNVDDYTLKHHLYLDECFGGIEECQLSSHYFSGDELSKKNGIKNHSIGYPDGKNIRQILTDYYA